MNRFHVIGVAYDKAGFERLAELSLSSAETEVFGAALKERGVSDFVVLSTCNRLEIYHAGEAARTIDVVLEIAALRPKARIGQNDFLVKSGVDALKHLFRVVGGLESLVVGETEITGQIKEAHRLASENGWVESHAMRQAFDAAFKTGKRIRTETDIGRGHFSVALTAIRVLENRVGKLCDLDILVVGAGKTGELATRHFTERSCASITVANRTRERAENLCAELKLKKVVDLAEVPDSVEDADVVVVAVEGGVPVIAREHLGPRTERPLHLIDLSMPPAIDPAVAEIEGVELIDIQSLQNVVATNVKRRVGALSEADAMIDQALERVELRLWEDSNLRPIVQRMESKISALLGEVFPALSEVALERGASRLVGMHLRKLKEIDNSLEDRRAYLESLMHVYRGPDQHR